MSSAFDKLARPVQKWIRGQGWRELNDIQTRAVHAILDTQADIIIAASTAGGKTEAAFLPLISQVLNATTNEDGFDVLYIGPLKALITDQARRLEELCLDAELPVTPWHGDVSGSIKSRILKRPNGILLITPESLEALFIRRGLKIAQLFKTTRAVVIDELHSVLDSERGIQMQSLLTRLELATKKSIRRIGLSATLGDIELVRDYLRPDLPEDVRVIKEDGGSPEIKLKLRGYISGNTDKKMPSATAAIAKHIFCHLRGSDNIVFAGARHLVEIYADQLRDLCEKSHLPQEFYPHHANLSREHRNFVEKRLKASAKPTTAICTSTLELGIDIGDVTCIGHIGAPFSVATLRQRLGRSGRREGRPAILRQYAVETELSSKSNFSDQLRLRLIRAVAMIDLLLEGWCEPPQPKALHLSTAVHQILSVIAEHGGAHAMSIYKILCRKGPFRQVDTSVFMNVLQAIGTTEIGLIEQVDDGLLLLGPAGEKLVEHYSFFAVFQTSEEYRLMSGREELGNIPINNMLLAPGMMLIFSGRRWLIQEIHNQERVIMVTRSKGGVPPVFGGDPGNIHDRVIERMFDVLEGDNKPIYMDDTSINLLDEARKNYARLRFDTSRISQLGQDAYALTTRCGTIKTTTLALALRSHGFTVHIYDGFLEVSGKDNSNHRNLMHTLESIAQGDGMDLFGCEPNLEFEKFHPYLTKELLKLDALSSRIDASSLPRICNDILKNQRHGV